MKKFITILVLTFAIINCIAQAPTTITAGMSGAQVRTALNANFGITDTASFNMIQFRKSTSHGVGIIFKGAIPWMHDYPGWNAGGGYTAGGIGASRGKSLYIGKWAGANAVVTENLYEGQNTAVGDSALAKVTTGMANTAIGMGALSKITTSSLNTAVGRQALYLFAGTEAGNNTSVGESALERLRTGTSNTALGTNAGMFLKEGSNNTLIGYNAGYGYAQPPGYVTELSTYTGSTVVGSTAYANVKEGGNNIAIGLGAMSTTKIAGSESIAIGTSALKANKISYNIGIGSYVAEVDTTGQMNIFIGSNVARASQGSSRSTVIGYNAASTMTNGLENVIIGSYAGNTITSGDENTFIGRSAGSSITTGSGNIFIGCASGYYETGSNKLFIDNTTRTNEADARIKALIYGVFAAAPVNQRVTINAVLKLTPMADPPGSPEEGMIYADTDHHLYYYNGSTWKQLDN